MNVLKNRLSYWLANYFLEFDNAYLKKRLVHDWPNCRVQNEELSERITNLADDYGEEFKKRKHEDYLNNLDNISNNNDFEMKSFNQGIINNFLIFIFS